MTCSCTPTDATTSRQNEKRLPKKIPFTLLKDVQENTSLLASEIIDTYTYFRQISPSGDMTVNRFRQALGMLGMIDDSFLLENMFSAFDTDNNGVLTFKEFAKNIGIMIRGNADEKATLSFRILCANHNKINPEASIDQSEKDLYLTLKQFQLAIYSLDLTKRQLIGDDYLQIDDKAIFMVFKEVATYKTRDNVLAISLDDFKKALTTNVAFSHLLGINPGAYDHYTSLSQPKYYNYSNNDDESSYTFKQGNNDSQNLAAGLNLDDENSKSSHHSDNIKPRNHQSSFLSTLQLEIHDIISELENSRLRLTKLKGINNTLSKNISMSQWKFFPQSFSLSGTKFKQSRNSAIIVDRTLAESDSNNYDEYRNNQLLSHLDQEGKMALSDEKSVNVSTKRSVSQKLLSFVDNNDLSFICHIETRLKRIQNYLKQADRRMYMNRPNFNTMKSKSHQVSILSRRKTLLWESTKGFAVHFGHPSWNTVLNIMVGIRIAAGRVANEPKRQIEPYDFIMKEKNQHSAAVCDEFQTQIDEQYGNHVKETFGVTNHAYLQSVGPEQLVGNMALGNLASLSELCSTGKSGSFFYYTSDGRFLIKTISLSDAKFFRRFLKDYYHHMIENPETLLTRFYGLHAMRIKRKYTNTRAKLYFVIMGNILHTPVEIHRRYDLKGSWYKRTVGDSAQQNPSVAMKDLDIILMEETINVGPSMKKSIMNTIRNDSDFFREHQIIDYSLIIGIHNKMEGIDYNSQHIMLTFPPYPSRKRDIEGVISADNTCIYYFGIIDFFGTYNFKKRLEHSLKLFTGAHSKSISSVNPNFYAGTVNINLY